MIKHLDSYRARARLRLALLMLVLAGPVWAQASEGERVFRQTCATCHSGAPDSRAPGPDALRARTPQAIIESLMTGAMRPQGSRLSGPERRAVAEFVTGKTVGGDVTGAERGRCSSGAASSDTTRGPAWSGWSPSSTNTRFQPQETASLRAADIPLLKLKWSLGWSTW